MSRGQRVTTIAASPVLVGAVAVLISLVATFLAYNANKGLPFVPTYRISAIVPDAARLTSQNEVRLGGNRIGLIESIDQVRLPNGEAAAKLNLQLSKNVEPLPRSTTVDVRYKSSFGLKYLELKRGSKLEGNLPEGGTLPLANAQPVEVEFDDVYNTFDQETRENSRINIATFGGAFAGRGASLNEAIKNFGPLLRFLEPVAGNLADPDTQLARFIREGGNISRVVAPVAAEQAELFTNMADTFAAMTRDPQALRDTISESVPTLEEGIRSFPVIRPFVRNLAAFSRELEPTAELLPETLPPLNRAMRVGTPVLNRSPQMFRRLENVFEALDDLVDAPSTAISLSRLGTGLEDVRPLVDHLTPYQTVCNYIGYGMNFLANHLNEEDNTAFAQRQYPVVVPNNEEQQGSLGGYSGIPANGRREADGFFEPNQWAIFHGHPYGPAVDSRGNADCQAGQWGYIQGRLPLPGQRRSDPSVAVPNIPGNRGPTFRGRERRP